MELRRTLTIGLLSSACAAVGQAQTDVPDRFRLEVGGFRINADSNLTLNRNGTRNSGYWSYRSTNFPMGS